MRVIHIEITNACNLECPNCTRHIGHHRKPFMMDLETVENGILSLVTPYTAQWQNFPGGFPGYIGIMGGEPTTHPQFTEICKLMQKHVPRPKRQFWTDGYRYAKYISLIEDTFELGNIHYNDHKDEEGWHQPLLIAADEVLSGDRELMWRLIHNCWIHDRWAGSITPKGGFFCEVAASMDLLFDGPGGYPIQPGWWAKNSNEFFDQVERACTKCSAAIPMPAVSVHQNFDVVSPGNLTRLIKIGSPRALRGDVVVYDEKLDREKIEGFISHGWAPWDHRSFQVYGDGQRIEQTSYRPVVFETTKSGDLVQIETK